MALTRVLYAASIVCLLIVLGSTLLDLSGYYSANLAPSRWQSRPGGSASGPKQPQFTYTNYSKAPRPSAVYQPMPPTEKEVKPSATTQTTPVSSIKDLPLPPAVEEGKPPATSQQRPVGSFITLPTEAASSRAKLQYDFPPLSEEADGIRRARLSAVKRALERSAEGYMTHAWGYDELAPVTGGYRTSLAGWGLAMVDGLDTLWITESVSNFEFVVQKIATIDFNTQDSLPLNVFEITIRYLGGLLGAYDISEQQYPLLLKKATELGDMLYDAFDTPNRMPVLHWRKLGVEVASGEASLSELGTLSLEFTRLTILTGDPKYYDAVQRITNNFDQHQNNTKLPGLWPTTVNAREFDVSQGQIFSLGGASDSFYEYLIKEYRLLDGRAPRNRKMYEAAIAQIKKHLLFKPMTPNNDDILLSGTAKVINAETRLDPQMDHLACFAGAMVAVGSKILDRAEDLELARKLVNGCVWAYNSTVTGIMPESFHTVPCKNTTGPCEWDEDAWGTDMISRNSKDEEPGDKELPRKQRILRKAERLRLPKGMSAIASRQYLLRPEAVESIFVLYRMTGDEKLRDEAWRIFEAITNQTRTEHAFSSIDDVTKLGSVQLDRMESYWTAETLKYFYLIFSKPNVVSLDKYVFNTEGHPLLIGYGTDKSANPETESETKTRSARHRHNGHGADR